MQQAWGLDDCMHTQAGAPNLDQSRTRYAQVHVHHILQHLYLTLVTKHYRSSSPTAFSSDTCHNARRHMPVRVQILCSCSRRPEGAASALYWPADASHSMWHIHFQHIAWPNNHATFIQQHFVCVPHALKAPSQPGGGTQCSSKSSDGNRTFTLKSLNSIQHGQCEHCGWLWRRVLAGSLHANAGQGLAPPPAAAGDGTMKTNSSLQACNTAGGWA